MGLVINFFRSRQLELIKFEEVILYFKKELNCDVLFNEEEVEIIYHEPVFATDYAFLITKRSRVVNLALLNPEYVNIRFLIELPAVAFEQATRQIIAVIDQLCQKFKLFVYFDGLDDIGELDLIMLMKAINRYRHDYLLKHPDYDLYYLDSSYLTHVANFHQASDFLKEEYADVDIERYQLMTNHQDKSVYLAIKWQLGDSAIFPPHLDYIIVMENDLAQVLKASLFFKKINRLLVSNSDLIPNVELKYLNKKAALKAQRKIKHLAKYFEHDLVFSNVNITNIVEK